MSLFLLAYCSAYLPAQVTDLFYAQLAIQAELVRWESALSRKLRASHSSDHAETADQPQEMVDIACITQKS